MCEDQIIHDHPCAGCEKLKGGRVAYNQPQDDKDRKKSVDKILAEFITKWKIYHKIFEGMEE